MGLQPGYNIVTERVAETDGELAALEFFRKLEADESLDAPLTVTGLEDLLYDAAEGDRDDLVAELRQVLRDSRSLGSMDAVQFLLDGQIVDDVEFRVRIERSEEAIYLNVGQLFVEEPQPLSATQAVARK